MVEQGPLLLPPFPLLPPAQVEALERFVVEASSQVDSRLIEVLLGRFQLCKHCDAIRRYLLLGQGDFVQALMDAVRRGGEFGFLMQALRGAVWGGGGGAKEE